MRQLARKIGISIEDCSLILRRLRKRGVVRCLNADARRGRVYIHRDASPPALNWDLYGWISFSHRRAVITTLDQPRQPSEIKRRARYLDPSLKMSANNVRDVIRLFVRRGIAKPVPERKNRHPRYELTEEGRAILEAVWAGEAP